MYVCVTCVCMYVCMYVCIYIHIYMYVHVYIFYVYMNECICIQKNRLESEAEQHKREIDQQKREIDQQKRVNDQQKKEIDHQKREIDQQKGENDQLKQEIDLQKREIDRLQNNIHGQQPIKQAQPKQPAKPSAKKVGYKKSRYVHIISIQTYCIICISNLCSEIYICVQNLL